jgi:hypothetical protein
MSALVTSLIVASGGYQGFVSAGLRHGNQNYGLSVTAGYTPEALAGHHDFIVTPKLDAGFMLNEDIRAYTSLATIMAVDKHKTFIFLPEQYPKNYYPSSGLFWAPSVGLAFTDGKHTLYGELVTLDYYAEMLYRGNGYIKPYQVATPMLGYSFTLKP